MPFMMSESPILLSDTHKSYDCTHSCHVCFGLVGTDMMGYLLVLLWIFFCNVIDIYVFSLMFPGIFREDLSSEYVSKNG
jgi:hypothetical protein